MEPITCLHAGLPRQQAEALLREHGMHDGLYLLRTESRTKEIFLSMAYKVRIAGPVDARGRHFSLISQCLLDVYMAVCSF